MQCGVATGGACVHLCAWHLCVPCCVLACWCCCCVLAVRSNNLHRPPEHLTHHSLLHQNLIQECLCTCDKLLCVHHRWGFAKRALLRHGDAHVHGNLSFNGSRRFRASTVVASIVFAVLSANICSCF